MKLRELAKHLQRDRGLVRPQDREALVRDCVSSTRIVASAPLRESDIYLHFSEVWGDYLVNIAHQECMSFHVRAVKACAKQSHVVGNSQYRSALVTKCTRLQQTLFRASQEALCSVESYWPNNT